MVATAALAVARRIPVVAEMPYLEVAVVLAVEVATAAVIQLAPTGA